MTPSLPTLVLIALVPGCLSDYRCVCNYEVETAVYEDTSRTTAPAGYMYEFDCKPLMEPLIDGTGFFRIEFEKKLRYVEKGTEVQLQNCPGNPNVNDKIPVTRYQSTTLQMPMTTPRPIAATTPASTTISTTTPATTTSRLSSSIVATTPTGPPRTVTHAAGSTRLSLTSKTPQLASVTSNSPSTAPRNVATTRVTPTPATTRSVVNSATGQTPKSGGITSIPAVSNFTEYLGSPLRFIGVGYNLLKGNPDSPLGTNPTTDPGLLAKSILKVSLTSNVSAPEVEYRDYNTCISMARAALVNSGKSYHDYLLSYAEPDARHLPDIVDKAFTLNKGFSTVLGSTAPGQWSVYKDVSTSCNSATVRYMKEKVTNHNFSISLEFGMAMCALPAVYDLDTYVDFIDRWGTSIVTEVDIGTRSASRFQSTLAKTFENIRNQDRSLFLHSGPFQGSATSLTIDTSRYSGSKAAHAREGTLLYANAFGSKLAPEPIRLKLAPLTMALDPVYWEHVLDQLKKDGVCPGSMDTSMLHNYTTNLNAAMAQYSAYKAAKPLQAYPLQLPVTWPVGTYGLMKATGGCPGGGTRWLEGWRRQDTEDINSSNQYTWRIDRFLSGAFNSDNLQTYYCIKSVTSSTPFDLPWSKGTYCLLKSGNCPPGFGVGSIFWDDEDLHNTNKRGGTLPEGSYDSNTRVNYCCRNDAPPSSAMTLPPSKPFVLLRYGTTCQTVFGMRFTDVFIRWDDEDLANKDSSWGAHPFDEGGRHDHKLHFCYYQIGSSTGIASVIG